MSKLGKQTRRLEPVEVELELAVETNPSIADNQVAEATVWLKGHTLRAREATRDMKASIDELTEKLVRQVKDERDRKQAERKIDKHALDQEAFEPVLAEGVAARAARARRRIDRA